MIDEPRSDEIGWRQIPTFMDFAAAVFPSLTCVDFHVTYYRILELFARGEIRRLIVSVPPQHGKSLGASVLLPTYILGMDPEQKIAIASYTARLASRFNRQVQRIIDTGAYRGIFPETTIKPVSARSEYIRTANHVEIIGHRGEVFSMGREGSLTGNQVDVMIMDDLYKDAMEADSPIIRENCWDWYSSVVRTRLHNDSRELMVFTRWNEEDLIGRIIAKEKNIIPKSWSELNAVDPDVWVRINFEAIKEGPKNELDPRRKGDALWPDRHSRKLLDSKKQLDPYRFSALYQGKPLPRAGLLYGDKFKTYEKLDEKKVVKRANYTDTADLGDDYLCSVCYSVATDGLVYVTDLVYTTEGMEFTEKTVAQMLERNVTGISYIESNNGGRGFARAVSRLAPHVKTEWFHQSGNKEARILSNSSTVLNNIRMPSDWQTTWSEFYYHLTTYRRLYSSNRWHDAPDVLTGIIEKEIVDAVSKKIRKFSYGP